MTWIVRTFKCPQMLNVKGRKKGVSHSFYIAYLTRFECFSKRPVIKCNAWDPEESSFFLSYYHSVVLLKHTREPVGVL